jgi:hypothetical protein
MHGKCFGCFGLASLHVTVAHGMREHAAPDIPGRRSCNLGGLRPARPAARFRRSCCRSLCRPPCSAVVHLQWRGGGAATKFGSMPPPTAAGVITLCVQLLSAKEEVLRQTLGDVDDNKYAIMITDHFRTLASAVLGHIIEENALRLEPCLEPEACPETPAEVIAAIFQIAAFDTSVVEEALGPGHGPVHMRVRRLLKMVWHWHRVGRGCNLPLRLTDAWALEHMFHVRDRFHKDLASIMRDDEWTLPLPRSVHDDSD